MDNRTLPLYTMMAYQLGWVDEHGAERPDSGLDRLRGSMCMLAAQSAGGDETIASAHAVAVELLHNYSLIHTDIQEGNPDRDGKPALWWVWGPAQGINAGDGMHALARLSVFGLRERGVAPEDISLALRHLDGATLSLCEGAYLDTVFQERLTVTVDEYLSMAHSFGGPLVAAALKLGLLSAGVREGPMVESLAEFGSKLGTAMRLAEDYAAFWGKGERDQSVQSRLIAKKKTLPVVHAMAEADPTSRRELGNAYAQRLLEPEHIARITQVLESTGSQQYTHDAIEQLMQDARKSLDQSGIPDESRASLEAVASYVVEAPLS